MTALTSALYVGRMTHTRRGPKRHAFGYRLHMLFLDLDEIDRRLPIGPLRRGRAGWLSFCRRDYLGDPARPLREEVLDLVEARLGIRPAGPVRLLTQVRCLGYVFNPVSFYYCYGTDGTTLEAVVAEITNTPWQERHAYVLSAREGEVRASFPKAFHVSPFFDLAQRYRWLITTPAKRLVVTMVNEEQGRDVFSATLQLERRPLTAGGLWLATLRQPLMTWRIHLGIYVQALRLWWKGTPYVEHPASRRSSSRPAAGADGAPRTDRAGGGALPSARNRKDRTWNA
jgi:DUF1365 family protein